MCGICGIFNINNKEKVKEKIMENMLKAIKHRGPDGSKYVINDQMALGFNRLSFIDLSGGMQPIDNEDRSISMICNGEIYNYKELRIRLIKKGHSFRTETDVEVILHMYEEYGIDFPKYLNGQFAIAVYDNNNKQMILVRDQIGICPLFYTLADGKVIFGSEIKAILEYPGIERKLNLKAVDQLMNFPGIVSPTTFFKGINALEAGHMLLIKPEQEIKNIEYWDLQYNPEEEDKGEDYYVEHVRELMKKAISRRLIADVPIGFYISGGLDSSIVSCFIGEYLMNSCYSFSAEVGSGSLDESKYQKIIRDCVKSNHYATKVTEESIWDNLYDVIFHAESAVKESYDVCAYMLSGLVSESPAKAVLTGQGSDEFFSGYVGYMVDLFRNMQKGQMSKEECEVNERLWGDPYFRFERNHPEIRKMQKKLYSGDVRGEINNFSAFATSPVNIKRLENLSSQKRRSYIDYKLRLSDHLLGEHGDRMFFSHSIEGRHPFLDSEFLEFAITIPDKYKLKGVDEKYILKKAAQGIVPDSIIKRKKFPFQAPGMSSMLKQPSKINFLDDSLIKKYGVFDVDYVNQLKQLYCKEDFNLMGAYEIDYLLIVMTVTMLCERYKLTI